MHAALNGFMATLRLIRGEYRWGVEKLHYGYGVQYLIRTDKGVCPLCAVGRYELGKPYGVLDHRKAGADLGLPDWLVTELTYASDMLMDWKPEVRFAILDAVGLSQLNPDTYPESFVNGGSDVNVRSRYYAGPHYRQNRHRCDIPVLRDDSTIGNRSEH